MFYWPGHLLQGYSDREGALSFHFHLATPVSLGRRGKLQVQQGRREHSPNCLSLMRLPIDPLCQGLIGIPILSQGRMSFLWWLSAARLRIRKHGTRAAFFFRWGDIRHPAALLFILSWAPKPASLPLTTFQSSCLVVACVFPWFRVVHSRKEQGKKSFAILSRSKVLRHSILKGSVPPSENQQMTKVEMEKTREQHMLRIQVMNLGEKIIDKLRFNNP